MKYVSRSQWGARAYRLPGGATQYSGSRRRGVKIHYLGGPYSDREHKHCAAYVRSVQNLHMDGNGWSDIGYSFIACTHGYVYEGRGLKRRNSANGNTSLNDQDYAVLALVGSSGLTEPTDPQLNGLRDAIEHCRNNGPAGDWLGGHKDGYPTACPGGPLYAWVQKGAPRPNTAPKEDDMPDFVGMSCTKPKELTDTWSTLSWDDEHVDQVGDHKENWQRVITGPATYTGTVYVRADQLTGPADQLLVRVAEVDGEVKTSHPVVEDTDTPGKEYCAVPITGHLPKGRHLVVQVKKTGATDAEVTANIKLLVWS